MRRLPFSPAFDAPGSWIEAAERLALAAKRHETWICGALMLGNIAVIWHGVVVSASHYTTP